MKPITKQDIVYAALAYARDIEAMRDGQTDYDAAAITHHQLLELCRTYTEQRALFGEQLALALGPQQTELLP